MANKTALQLIKEQKKRMEKADMEVTAITAQNTADVAFASLYVPAQFEQTPEKLAIIAALIAIRIEAIQKP